MSVAALLWSVMLVVPSLTGLAQTTTNQLLTGPITNPANGHLYYLLSQNTYTASEAEARTLGGYLVTINDAAENQWVFDTFSDFGGIPRCLWIGLRDVSQTGDWRWESGQAVTYLNWAYGGPNYIGQELYVYMYPAGFSVTAATWNNYVNATNAEGPLNGVVEVEPPVLPRTATASAVVTNGFVIAAIITDGGYGYTNTPTVATPARRSSSSNHRLFLIRSWASRPCPSLPFPISPLAAFISCSSGWGGIGQTSPSASRPQMPSVRRWSPEW